MPRVRPLAPLLLLALIAADTPKPKPADPPPGGNWVNISDPVVKKLTDEGKKFGYNLMDSKEDRAKAVEKWKKLIPTGQMPPKANADAEK